MKERPILWPYLEAVVMVACIALLNTFVFPGNPAFKGLPFSLLWVPIILIAGRYGTLPALFTALLCGGYYFYLVSLEEFFLGRFQLSLDDKVITIAFAVVAVFLGQMYDRLHDEILRWRHRHDELQTQFDNLHQHFTALEKANTELEKRIVGRQDTIGTLYSVARGFESLDAAQLHRAVCELAGRFLHADRICLYLRDEAGEIGLAEKLGYDDADAEALSTKGRTHPLIAKAFAGDRVVSFRDLPDHDDNRRPERERTLLAAPIFLAQRQTTVGVIAVDRLPFLAMNAANLRILGIIADWAARAIEQSLDFSGLKARELDDELTGVYSYQYFGLRIGEEMSRSQRYRLPMSLLILALADFEAMAPELQRDLLSIVGLVFSYNIRDVDIACRFDNPSSFAIILPLTDQAGAKILTEKLRAAIESYQFKPYGDDRLLRVCIGTHTFVSTAEGDSPYKVPPAVVERFIDEARRAAGKP